jgi:hypothetical protein
MSGYNMQDVLIAEMKKVYTLGKTDEKQYGFWP